MANQQVGKNAYLLNQYPGNMNKYKKIGLIVLGVLYVLAILLFCILSVLWSYKCAFVWYK